MATKLLLIAIDGLAEGDISIRSLPTSWAKVPLQPVSPASVCPTLTSLVTGVYPDRHGVVSDAPCSVGTEVPVLHRLKNANRAQTIFAVARAAGLKTAAINWPLTAGDADIDLLVPDCADDNDAVAQATAILTEHEPDLVVLRLHDVLDARTAHGLDSREAEVALEALKGLLIPILALAENTLLVSAVVPQTVTRKTHLNAELVRHGLISLDETGCFADYKAWCQSNGLSSFVYLKNPSNMGVHDQIEELLEVMRQNGHFGIGSVLSREDAAVKYHLYGGFSFVVCSDGQTEFGNGVTALETVPVEKASCGHVGGENGFLLATGSAFVPKEVTLKPLPDVAATCASLLGLKMPMAKGKPIVALLQN